MIVRGGVGGGGGQGLPILVMSLSIVPQIPCQRIFVRSDPAGPRTFVMDCICVTRRDYDVFSGKIQERAPCFALFYHGVAFSGTNYILGSSIFLFVMISYILWRHVKAH